MYRLKILTPILRFSILLCLFYLPGKPGMGAFHKQIWSPSEFLTLMKDESMTWVYKPETNDILGKVGIKVVLPDFNLKDSTIQIASYRLSKKTHNNIYIGPYKEIIVLDADHNLLGDGTSQSDGYDFLEFTFVDTKNRITYICMQERPYLMWQLSKVVTINFLPYREQDENGEPYCYEASIHGVL